MKRAFTLIELLVVIAIIAVLAAILFPVFAQAKEAAKRTSNLADVKGTGIATALYTSDADDTFPLAYGMDPNGHYDVARYNGIPAGWDAPTFEQGDEVIWGNAIRPYAKSDEALRSEAAPDVRLTGVFGAGAYAHPRKTPIATSLTMNGLLSTYGASAVAAPSELVLYWYGYGRENLVGSINMQPALNCAKGVRECRFNPNGLPAAAPYNGADGDLFFPPNTDANDSVWFFGQGQNMARTDTSAKFYRLGGPGTDRRNVRDPYASYGRRGDRPLAPNRCAATEGGTRYSSFFRPDNEFRHGFGSAALCFP